MQRFWLEAHLHPIRIGWVRYVLLTATAAPFAVAAGRARSRQPPLRAIRALGLAGSAVLFIGGLQRLPMAAATALA